MSNTPPTGTTPTPAPTQATPVDTTGITDANALSLDTNNDALTKLNETQERNNRLIQNSTSFINAWNDKSDIARATMDLWNTAISKGTDAFSSLGKMVTQTMNDMSRQSDLTSGQMAVLSAAITGVVGAGKSFSGMDFSHVNTFSSQIDMMVDALGHNDTALGILANKLGIVVPDSARTAAGGIGGFIKNMAASADNAVKLEDVYVRAAARTGQLGAVHEQAGASLEHMNRMVRDQRSAISEAVVATNLSTDTIEKYYAALQELPVGLKAGATASEIAKGNTASLVTTIQLARGTGRDYSEVLQDMHQAIRDYNASLPDAMKFTAQISEISKNYNIELQDVRSALTSTADAFKMFGNEAQGAAMIMNQYVGALKNTGLSGAVASDIVKNMTQQIGQLSIAQKAFLSAQSGGPGGLMGSFAIDMMLRRGQLDQVFRMVQQQLTRMMGGRLVSTQEAALSPQAAAQMTRQIMVLQQGPLGQFARTSAEAERIIDAFKGGRAADIKALSMDPVKDAVKTGNDYAAQTATGISRMVALMEEARGLATGGALNVIQAGATAGAGEQFEDQTIGAVQDMRAGLKDAMRQGAVRSTQPANAINFMGDVTQAVKDIPTQLKATVQGVTNLVRPAGAMNQPVETQQEFMNRARAAAANARSATPMGSARVVREEDLPEFARAMIDQRSLDLPPPDAPTNGMAATAAGVANRQTAAGVGNVASGAQPIAGPPGPTITTQGGLGQLTVHVEGYCIDCGEKMRGSSQRLAVAPQTRGTR